MEKVFNEAWMKEMLNNKKETSDDYSGSLPDIEWVRYKHGFKKKVIFKVLPANTKEDNVFCHIVNTHWLDIGDGKSKRFVCPEETVHLKKAGVKCPICEAKRKLLKMGFTEEQLSIQGKYGLIPVFDPKATSNCKVVILQSDEKSDWDRAHVSVLQQNGSFMTIWLAQQYANSEIPNFTDYVSSNPVMFTRPNDMGKWERGFGFNMFQPSAEVLEKLKMENEALTLTDLWKMPSDQEFMEVNQIVEDMCNNYIKARETINQPIVEEPIQTMPMNKINDYVPTQEQFATTNNQTTTVVNDGWTDVPF